eukprot:1011128-Alexandrium_andersonii.AAC.1
MVERGLVPVCADFVMRQGHMSTSRVVFVALPSVACCAILSLPGRRLIWSSMCDLRHGRVASEA